MLAETVSLGILSLPAAVASLGLLPGAFLIVSFGLMTTYTGYEVYRFHTRFPAIRSFAEAAQIIGGPVGRWIVEIMQMIFLLFIMAGHIIIFRSMVFKLSEGNSTQLVCGVWSTLLALGINIACTLPRALKTNSWFSIFCERRAADPSAPTNIYLSACISILAATFTAMASVIRSSQQQHRPLTSLTIASSASFSAATAAVSNILLSYTGHIAYFTIIAEMHTPHDFPKALLVTNFLTTTLYALAGCVIYKFVGTGVASPALDSASPTFTKIAYSLAIPTIIVAGVIAALVASKRAYDIVWFRRPHVTGEKTPRAWASWIAIVVVLWTLAWIIGNVVPWFKSLLAVIGAAVGTWICLGLPAIFVLHRTWKTGDGRGGGGRYWWVFMSLCCLCVLLPVGLDCTGVLCRYVARVVPRNHFLAGVFRWVEGRFRPFCVVIPCVEDTIFVTNAMSLFHVPRHTHHVISKFYEHRICRRQ